MKLRIRPMSESDADYAATADIWTANWPEYPKTAEMYRYSAETRDPMSILGRLVAEDGDGIVATGYFREESDNVAEGKFLLYTQVHPDHHGVGIGGALFDDLLEHLEVHSPKILSSFTREDHEAGVAFLEKRGFRVAMKEQDSELDLSTFDPAKFVGVVEKVRESGIEILPASELAKRDPGWMTRAWELHGEIIPDVPDDDVLTNVPYEQFDKSFKHPDFIPEGYFLALDGDRYVGMSSVWNRRVKKGEVYTRLTGVVRSHRRRGIATALKIRAQEFAKSMGARVVVTDNEENNPMYDLNVQLGFRPTKAWLQFRKELGATRDSGATGGPGPTTDE
ncbi:MAG: GNAT family N-acetyltransferase [Candidatus Eisenbacteria bacterium]